MEMAVWLRDIVKDRIETIWKSSRFHDYRLKRSQLFLPSDPLGPSRYPRRVCKLCDIGDWRDEEWLGYLDEMGESHLRTEFHRKGWEYAQGAYAAEQLGLLREDSAAIGVGSGTESILYYFANRIQTVTATDIYGEGSFMGDTATDSMLTNPEAFARVPYRKEHLRTLYMDGTQLDFPDNSFDFAFSFSSIEHFGGHDAARKAMLEMARVIKPGGAVIVTTEVILNRSEVPSEFFRPSEIYKYLIHETGLSLLEDIDYQISDETLLLEVIDMTDPANFAKTPHIILKVEDVYWTSLMLVLLK